MGVLWEWLNGCAAQTQGPEFVSLVSMQRAVHAVSARNPNSGEDTGRHWGIAWLASITKCISFMIQGG